MPMINAAWQQRHADYTPYMANILKKRRQNVDGAFFVDKSCIDCDTCRWLAPDTFQRVDEQSYVYQQPQTELQIIKALQAQLACPTTSIGNLEKTPLIASVRDMFPLPIDKHVYYCGFHSAKSYGAASYLIQHPDGNILIDSPRYNGPLVNSINKLGGVRYLFLSHQDDVADHQQFADEFDCERIMHQDDIDAATQKVEIQLDGQDPYHIYPDVSIHPTPGHTAGHAVLHAFKRHLFTGDHLAWSVRLQQLYAFKNHCWHDWDKQIQSMQQLSNLDFSWVLPAHGRRFQTQTPAEMRVALQACIDWMRLQ